MLRTCQQIFLPLWLLILDPLGGNDNKPVNRAALREAKLHRQVYLLASWAISWWAIISLGGRNSTYICASGDRLKPYVRINQFICIGLDSNMVLGVSRIARGTGNTPGKSWRSVSKIALIAVAVLVFLAIINPLDTSIYASWSLHRDLKAIAQLCFGMLLFTSWITSIVYLLHDLRPSTLVMIMLCLSLYTSQVSIWPYQFLDISGFRVKLLVAMSLASFGSVVGLLQVERDASRSQRFRSMNGNSIKILIGLLCVVSSAFLGSSLILHLKSETWPSHPISLLIAKAKPASSEWEAQAISSRSLPEAVVAYQSRYGIYPPPNFDKWYKYAVKRNSAVIDNFDQINNDLLPFWAIEPLEIRTMTANILERPWTEVAGIRIVNGTARISPHMPPAQRWVLEGALSMINKFVQWLPDMDLAFNIDDESRVAVPWEEMQKLKRAALLTREEFNKTRVKVRPTFFPHVVDMWQGDFMSSEAPNKPDVESELFEAVSFKSSFEQYATTGCPPDSLVRRQQWPNPKRICHHCPEPHLLGSFVKNWTLSGSLCHQPDMANLHGFHFSAPSFKASHKLLPIFSPSKIPTFNDIVYPSPQNYIANVFHDDQEDKEFSMKEDTAFWRGTNSEGVSILGAWQGMQRQRFVYLMNKTPSSAQVSLVLPEEAKYAPQILAVSDIRAATSINVGFVGNATGCSAHDCETQSKEFSFTQPVGFQEHWRYKYLFDLDGVGIIPFLQSRSLVLRASLFRQWFDERLVAWKHFVPVDGRLDDIWGLLAYFGGVGENARDAHKDEAKTISEDGRDWAGKVLRKEDMEIYMFRLLLEWGRIVDDRRAQMGFSLP